MITMRRFLNTTPCVSLKITGTSEVSEFKKNCQPYLNLHNERSFTHIYAHELSEVEEKFPDVKIELCSSKDSNYDNAFIAINVAKSTNKDQFVKVVIEQFSSMCDPKDKKYPDEIYAVDGYGMIGLSDQIKEVRKAIWHCLEIPASVLIQGDTGVGKDLVAIAIHNGSRRSGNFVSLNCANLVESTIDSELFGTVKGSYTGSVDKPGKFELANKGTLFIDEVGEMSFNLQAKLLRVLEDGVVTRINSNKSITVDVQIVCASWRNLKDEVTNGHFREDLLDRIYVHVIHVPPQRERQDDIIPLAEFFLKKIADDYKKPPKGLPKDTEVALMKHEWRDGNIRELRNSLIRGFSKSPRSLIEWKYLGLSSLGTIDVKKTDFDTYRGNELISDSSLEFKIRKAKQELEVESKEILHYLEKAGWDRSVAEILWYERNGEKRPVDSKSNAFQKKMDKFQEKCNNCETVYPGNGFKDILDSFLAILKKKRSTIDSKSKKRNSTIEVEGKVMQALDMLHANPKMTKEQLAKAVGLPPATFSRTFGRRSPRHSNE